MELIYLLGNGSEWGDNEIRYSLRSVQQFGRNVSKVTVVGQKPYWLRNVEHIEAQDPHPNACDNAWHKLRLVCEDRTEPFVLMNDDFFLLQGTDFADLPLYYDGTISELLDQYKRVSPYTEALRRTRQHLAENNLQELNTCLHVPMPVFPGQMEEVWPLFQDAPGLSFRALYGNIALGEHLHETDCKLRVPMTMADIGEALKGRQFFSTGERFLDEEGQLFLMNLYPEKSIYE